MPREDTPEQLDRSLRIAKEMRTQAWKTGDLRGADRWSEKIDLLLDRRFACQPR